MTVLFSDLEGRLHLLDYDKKFLLDAYENLNVRRLVDSRIYGRKRKAICAWASTGARSIGCRPMCSARARFWCSGVVIDKDGTLYSGDMRGVLKSYADKLHAEKNYTLNAATEIEGFLFGGKDAEKNFHETGKFEFVSTGGYYHSLPLDPLRQFIDTAAEVQRAMGFQNEKDHPEVAPSQFEINFGYAEAVAAADQIQLYKLLCRQIANNYGCTASFLPKPVVGVERQRDAHQRFGFTGQNEFVLGRKGRGTALDVRLVVPGPDSDAGAGSLPDLQLQRERVSAAGPAL